MSDLKAFNRRSAYQWYLGSAFWRERRTIIFQRANGQCERCKLQAATQVHHLSYLRVFNELPTDLMAVCAKCHAEIHDRTPANDNQLSFDFKEPSE
jgi:5-methylcytosine-specific restriction endonuclease McrA